jgi:hypothetical protein
VFHYLCRELVVVVGLENNLLVGDHMVVVVLGSEKLRFVQEMIWVVLEHLEVCDLEMLHVLCLEYCLAPAAVEPVDTTEIVAVVLLDLEIVLGRSQPL